MVAATAGGGGGGGTTFGWQRWVGDRTCGHSPLPGRGKLLLFPLEHRRQVLSPELRGRGPVDLHSEAQARCNAELEQKEMQLKETLPVGQEWPVGTI